MRGNKAWEYEHVNQNDMVKEAWINKYIITEMEKWDVKVPNRIEKIKKTVAKGYDQMVSSQIRILDYC